MTIRSHTVYGDWTDIASLYEEALPTMYDLPSENQATNISWDTNVERKAVSRCS